MKSHRAMLLGGIAAASQFFALGAVAHAQSTPEPVGTDEVVVTAMKRGENLQDIPASVTAVNGETLADRGLLNLEDIASQVPNLNWGEHFGTTLITIRGVGSTVDSGITEPTVAMYVDGVFMPRSTMSTLRAVDLERVEVLRGPQGTLYGRNATGGAINLISQSPSRTFEGEVNLSAGDRSAYGVSGFLSGPLGKGVFARLSGGREEQDGYVDVAPGGAQLNGADVSYVRGALLLEPTDKLGVELAVRHEQSDAANAYQQLLTLTFLPTPGQTTVPNRITADQPFAQKTETTVASATVNWDLTPGLKFRSISSYVDHSSSVDVDADSTILDGFNTIDFSRPSESYGQELNLIGESDRVSWILGLYYFKEEASNALPLRLGAAFAPGFGVPVGTRLIQSVASETSSVALFGDVTFSFTDRLRGTLGLRHNREEQDFSQNLVLNIPGVGIAPGGAAFAAGPVLVSSSSNKTLPKIGLQYDVSDDVNVYAQWSQGFKSGGLNLEGGSGLSVGALGIFKPEEIDAFEVGLKSQLFNRSVTANFAAFYYDYSDLQVTITVPPTTTLVQNADATVKGLEAEFLWDVNEAFTLNAAATYTQARFDGFSGFDDANPGLGVQNLDGEPLPHAPDVTLNLGAAYTINFGGELFSDLTLRADAFYSDDVVLRYFGTPNDTQEAYSLLNLSAKLTGADDSIILRGFVNNVTDEEYLQNVTYIGAVGAYMGNYGTPRTWGVQLSKRF